MTAGPVGVILPSIFQRRMAGYAYPNRHIGTGKKMKRQVPAGPGPGYIGPVW